MAGDKAKFLYCADVMELLQCKQTKASNRSRFSRQTPIQAEQGAMV